MNVHRKGFSLLMVLFVLSAILVTGLSGGIIILRQLKTTGTGDRGIQAFYAAESGLEDALYAFRQLGQTNLTVNQGEARSIGRASWWRDGSRPVTGLNMSLLENEVTELVLFDSAGAINPAGSIQISWSSDHAVCPKADFTWLEVVQSYWDGDSTETVRWPLPPGPPGGTALHTLDLVGEFPSLRLRALYGPACHLSVTAYEGIGGTPPVFNLPTQIQVTATGEMGDTRQALSILLPARAAQFSAFDYTIFSEQSICKDVALCD